MSSKITEDLLDRTNKLEVIQEVSAGGEGFSMFNSGGIEVEVAELLYGLIRCWQPTTIVETGTHLGVSSAYMAQALEDNKKGDLITYEVIPSLLKQAKALWTDLQLNGRITGVLQPSLQATIQIPINFLFLDSEPQYRFDEFIKFWPLVSEGGLIAIHDLHPSLGKHGQVHHGVLDWPYGEWEPKLGKYVKDLDVQMIHVPNPRGMVLLQKTRPTDENIRYLRGCINA